MGTFFFAQGCAYTLKVMDGREGCLHRGYIMLWGHIWQRAVFVPKAGKHNNCKNSYYLLMCLCLKAMDR